MKHKNTLIQLALALSILVLYILHFCSNSRCPSTREHVKSATNAPSAHLPVAYINIDSLLLNYNYSKDLNEVLVRKRENAQATLTQKARQLDTEMKEFQRKHENNAFLSEQSFKSQQQDLMKKQQNLQALEQNLSQELVKEQQKMNEQLRDSVYRFLRSYNKTKKYQIIISNNMNDNIMIADPVYNITDNVVKILNSQYKKTED